MKSDKILIDICQRDDLNLLLSLMHQEVVTSSSTEISALVYVYRPKKILKYLMDSKMFVGVNQNDPVIKRHQTFKIACADAELKTVKEMIHKGFDFHQYDESYFDIAIINDHLEIAEFLFANGSANFNKDPNILHNYIEQCFQVEFYFNLAEEHKAKAEQAKKTIQFLLEKGYNLNHIRKLPNSSETVLDIAIYWQRAGTNDLTPLIDFLQKKGQSPKSIWKTSNYIETFRRVQDRRRFNVL